MKVIYSVPLQKIFYHEMLLNLLSKDWEHRLAFLQKIQKLEESKNLTDYRLITHKVSFVESVCSMNKSFLPKRIAWRDIEIQKLKQTKAVIQQQIAALNPPAANKSPVVIALEESLVKTKHQLIATKYNRLTLILTLFMCTKKSNFPSMFFDPKIAQGVGCLETRMMTFMYHLMRMTLFYDKTVRDRCYEPVSKKTSYDCTTDNSQRYFLYKLNEAAGFEAISGQQIGRSFSKEALLSDVDSDDSAKNSDEYQTGSSSSSRSSSEGSTTMHR